jgi:hypothetical protein
MTKPDLMALCAIRYTIGRSSYIVSEGVKWAKEWGRESEYMRRIIIRDLAEAVARCDDGAEALGDIMDEKAWRVVLADLLEIDLAAKEPVAATDLLAEVQRAICDEMPMGIGLYDCEQAARTAIAVIAQECTTIARKIADKHAKAWNASFVEDTLLAGKTDGANEVADAIRQRFKTNG